MRKRGRETKLASHFGTQNLIFMLWANGRQQKAQSRNSVLVQPKKQFQVLLSSPEHFGSQLGHNQIRQSLS